MMISGGVGGWKWVVLDGMTQDRVPEGMDGLMMDCLLGFGGCRLKRSALLRRGYMNLLVTQRNTTTRRRGSLMMSVWLWVYIECIARL